MVKGEHYVLTKLADSDLVAINLWSRSRWGNHLTLQYMADFDKGAEWVAMNHKTLRSRSELTADTWLSIYLIREHYIIFHPVADDMIVIVAVLRQGRDIPAILRDNNVRIEYELKQIMGRIERGELVIARRKQ